MAISVVLILMSILQQTPSVSVDGSINHELNLARSSHQHSKISSRASKTLTSIYTDFAKQCRTLQEGDGFLRACSGIAGYKFLLLWEDDALTITMLNPRGRKFDLGLREAFVGMRPYADLLAKAEWRVRRERGRVVPMALIVRVLPMNDLYSHNRPFLAVAKITKQEICITDKITPGGNENVEARRAADFAATKPCLKTAE